MKNKAKRVVSAVCALAMCAAMLPAAAFADEPIADSSIQVMSDEKQMDFTLSVGQTIELDGEPTTNTHSWTVGGSNKDCIEFVGANDTEDVTTEDVTIKAVKGGTCTVTHSYGTENWWQRGIEVFSITVNASPTLENMTFQAEVTAMPYNEDGTQATSVEIPFELTYRGDKPGNLADESFGTVEYTATVNAANTPVEVTTNESIESLPEGFYCLSFAGDENVWDKDAALKDESIYYEVTAEGAVNLVNKAGSSTSSEENRVVTLNPKLYTLDYRSGSSAGDIVGEAPDDVTYQYNQIATVAENTMTREGYTFVNWKDMMGEQFWNPGDTIQMTSNISLFANWVEGTVNPDPDPDPEPDPEPEPDPVPPETDPVTPNPDEEDGVTVDKTATGLVDDKSNVTLTVGGGEETTASDVVFVLDKSASSDIRQEAMDMLTELQKQAGEGNIINVGVVNFEKGVLEQLELTALNDENYAAIEKAMIFQDVASSGTNIYAGLVAGEAMLDADTTVDDANKHLVLVTDGVGYLWGDGSENNVFSIYSESTSNGEENLYASHETIDWHHSSTSYYDEFKDMLKWYNDNSASIAADMNTYQMVYEEGQYTATAYNVPHGQGQNTDWSLVPKFNKENSYVPAELENATASAPDAAIYMVAREWIKIAEKYNAYAYADPRYAKSGDYLWAYNAISNLGDLGDASYTLPENAADYDGMFDAVKSTVLYDIESGTVTDVIGSNFDVASLDSFVLTVGGIEMKGVVNGNTINFGEAVDGVYPYVVTYTTGENEQFTWAINVPVEDGAAVQLTYTVKLVNKATTPGDYTVPTNEEATLDYNSTTGEQGTETFPVPEVTYNVPETTTVTATATPAPDEHPDIAEGIANGTWGGAPTATPAQTMSVPQTSDDLPLGALILVAVVAAGAVCGLVVLRKRGEQ